MKDIVCPNCGTTFQVDESVYAAILNQVRSKEFNDEVGRRIAQTEEQFRLRAEAEKSRSEKDFEKRLAGCNRDTDALRNELTRLKGVLAGYESAKKAELTTLEITKDRQYHEAVAEKDRLISQLEMKLAAEAQTHKLALIKERTELNARHSQALLDKQAEIDRLKDFKLRMSTKMVGETLEQHCLTVFEQARCMGMFPDATFEKDNTVVEHSKGDFIFRDFVGGNEYVSVMFEMKNEVDTTATKHRNDDFLDKLDKDRRRKSCEYAVLVSMLEQDNELYNAGIVDKSYRYPKMLVIRPQFFMPVLRLLSECARKGYMERRQLTEELESARSHTADFARFEEKLNQFRTSFNNNVTTAHKKFVAATEGIDKTIEALEKQIKALREIKANFEASEQRLLKANELADEKLTVKKLTHGNPNIRRMIDEAADEL